MRMFRSSNKSQASLERHTDSRDQSPVQKEPGYPPPQQLYADPPRPVEETSEERYYRNPVQSPTHPQHVLNRSHSNRVSSAVGAAAVDAYAKDPPHQHTVNAATHLSPVTPGQQAHHNPGPPISLQSPPHRSDKDKKSKRRFLGLGTRKEEKDTQRDRTRVNRTGSVLRKPSQQQQQPLSQSDLHSPQDGQSERFPGSETRLQAFAHDPSSENLPLETDQYEKYYRPSQYDNPQGANPRQSIQYADNPADIELPPTPRHIKQPSLQSQQSLHAGYQVYHQPASANSSTAYLHQQLQNATGSNPLRPPSPASIGPPSPLPARNPTPDSRPATADQQGRHPFYSVVQTHHPPDSIHNRQVSQDILRPDHDEGMGRNDGSNGNARQHRGDDDRHPPPHYANQQDPRIRTQSHDQGRNTPPPRNREDLASLDYHQLLSKHEELLTKYSKVKRYYFEREAQVTQLQNTVANQRLSLSKTSLDDAQYSTRFDRLNGAVQNLSFNIRKEWRRIPNWLAPVCNRDACQIGTKEMTAVGRACITRWLFESLFEQIFHPGIDPVLSYHLKSIERNLRRPHYGAILTHEQQDDLMTKIMTWRLTTVEGLQDVLARQSEQYTELLTHTLTKQLTDYMRAFLADPPPPGLPDNLYTIVSQAVGICANIPLESRDICVDYFMPGHPINDTYMRLEPGMTALQNPGFAPSATDHYSGVYNGKPGDDDQGSTSSSPADQADIEAQIREATGKGTSPNPAAMPPRKDSMSAGPKGSLQGSDKNSSREPKKGSFLGGFVNKRPAPGSASNASSAGAGVGLALQHSDSSKSADSGSGMDAYNFQSLTGGLTDGKIRFAAFLAVEVRGRSVLSSKDNERGKESDKLSTHGTDSAGLGQGVESGSGGGGSKAEKLGINILYKAPVYTFE